jgi:prenyltransferase beta subunit
MIAAAARAKSQLTDSTDLVAEFTAGRINPDGGFRGRTDQSDLYYTVFGIESLIALGARVDSDPLLSYLKGFADGRSLDLVHLACLARCRANLRPPEHAEHKLDERIAHRLEFHRCADGGYSNSMGAKSGTAYACFLALGTCQDLKLDIPNPAGLIDSILSLQRPDGSFANDATIQTGSTPATAAAVTTLHYLNCTPPAPSVQWLLARSRATGGFLAAPVAPIPDLLSTATAIHALSLAQTPLDDIKQPTLEFIDSLWSTEGAFAGNWLDETLDCEYTYYGLLALGHLNGE